VEGLSSLLAWFVEHEAALSGVAATVVIVGFIASPLGAGLRGLIRRWALSSAGVVEASVAPQQTTTDIPPTPEPEADRRSIAVLPFVSSADDKDSEIFADGMTDDIITALGHVPGFFVTSSSSTFVYKQQSVDARQIGRELDVRYVVEGRIQRAGNEVRINAMLVEAHTGDQIWSERFSGDLSDIFALQDEVSRSIVGQLQPELMQAEWRRSARTPTENLDAWTLVHSALMRIQIGYDREAMADGKQMAEAALDKDPDYAEAHGVLALVTLEQVVGHWSDNSARDSDQAAYHCRRALDLDPENPIVLYCGALSNMWSGNPEASLVQLERSCATNPNDAYAQALRGLMLGLTGRGEEGVKAGDLALRLSPRDPRTHVMLHLKALSYVTLGRYPEAERTHRRSIDKNNGFVWAWAVYAVELAMQDKIAEAKAALSELKKVAPDLEYESWESLHKMIHGNPTGERGALIDRQTDSLRSIWPS